MITIPMTPLQFQDAVEKLDTPGNGLTVNEALTPTTGKVANSQIAFDYAYDGTTLTLTITAKHGLAKFASDDAIKSHILELLN